MSLKLMGLWGMYMMRRRVVGVFLDPILACNLQCKMCYFSDPDRRVSLHGTITEQNLDLLEKHVLPYAVKLQIGCGAEPTLYHNLSDLVKQGRRAGVPYISLTTNGQLVATGRVDIAELVENGLDEITLSMHGTKPQTYNTLMTGGDFEKFKMALSKIATVKTAFNNRPLLRINFTVNSFNIPDIQPDNFWQLWQDVGILPDVIQIRPVQNIGPSAWRDFDPSPIKEQYHNTIEPLIARCKELCITIIAPNLNDIDNVGTPRSAAEKLLEEITYCYVSPDGIYKSDFDITHGEDIHHYLSRKNSGIRIWKTIFHPKGDNSADVSKKLNYTIK